ncbi:Tetratricopeptide-like helical [Penicillium coprophilum]|uniref:Tetratricopeptide-like helical n=1 Tax=Penicillium coprophilum TaxID=36646 RepID=UPI00238A32FD|nr:Tetratricopeptide-like helical [Penicillium coprophilum]KAJ5163261.1 Tetratricopeptide-like helical [Penicillium coprophilum]
MFISKSDKMIPSSWRERLPEDETSQWMAGDWPSMGNEYLNQSKYSKGLECSPTEEETHYLLYYRGLAFFRVDEWDASLRDLDAIPAGPKSENEDVSAKEDFCEAIARLAEQKKGRYNFEKMQEKASKTWPPLLDHATWIVKAGGLILYEKAFTYATEHPGKPKWSSTLHINTETRTVTRGGQAALASTITEKLYRNPSLAPVITGLHSSKFKHVSTGPVDGKPAVDTFQIAHIISLNSFGSPTSSRADHIHDACDASRTPRTLHNCGIWPYASTINHSCMSNVHRAFIGDMMIIRAATDIPVNTELKIWYLLPAPDYQPIDFRHWGFECCCSICVDIATALENSLSKVSLARAETLIECLAKTYAHPLEQVPQLGLWEPLTLIAGVYERHKRPDEAAKAVNRALASVGFVLDGSGFGGDGEVPLVVKKWGSLWMGLSLLETAPERAMQVERYARMTYLICVGEETSFDATYGESLEVACGRRPKESQVEGWVV